jgi:crossover junction endodeoxyribonuclease RuvC
LKKERIILGIDPGTNIMGYGIIHVKGNTMQFVSMGVVHLNKLKDPMLKLKKIFDETSRLIKLHHIDEVALEAPFYGKNVQSMLKLGRAQGVAIAASLALNVPANEYAPKRIKQAITGSGSASKEQVAAMLKSILKIEKDASYLDASDGLAVAVCHFFQNDNTNTKVSNKNYSGWKSFISQNKDRLK